MSDARPTELAITLAALACRSSDDGWVYADEIRGQLLKLGFSRQTSAQQVASWLKPMCSVECPWFERGLYFGGYWRYRVTRFGITDVENKMARLRVVR